MKNILLLAAPAAGKGTQAGLLKEKYGICPISTGDLLRQASSVNDEMGQKLQEIMKSGKLVDDETVLELLKKRFQELSGESFLLDGFPRNVNQAHELDILLNSVEQTLDYVFWLDVPKEVLEKRITGRRTCASCGKIHNIYLEPDLKDICSCGGMLQTRHDDTIEAFQTRYQTYLDATLPLVEYYQNQGILHRIDATRTIEEVFLAITSIMDVRGTDDFH